MLELWKVTRSFVCSRWKFSPHLHLLNGTFLPGTSVAQFRKTINLQNFSTVSSRCKSKELLASNSHLKQLKCQKYTLSEKLKKRNRTVLFYTSALTVIVGGFTYSSVLLYRIYCQATGKGGQAVQEDKDDRIINMKTVKDRLITVNFNADTNAALMWNFKPQQAFVKVSPGETALAFYSALNPSSKPVTGIATYNVVPYEAGKYFNKIQCFCFEEQLLNPNEEVDMPVFFYLDPEYANDPWLESTNDIILSYTFFEAKDGIDIPQPEYLTKGTSVK